jgi:hypothetical protein
VEKHEEKDDGGWNFAPFRVSSTYIRNYRRRHPFAMKPIANERRWNFSGDSGFKFFLISKEVAREKHMQI